MFVYRFEIDEHLIFSFAAGKLSDDSYILFLRVGQDSSDHSDCTRDRYRLSQGERRRAGHVADDIDLIGFDDADYVARPDVRVRLLVATQCLLKLVMIDYGNNIIRLRLAIRFAGQEGGCVNYLNRAACVIRWTVGVRE